ncbi:LysR substrate-binding domain-containing protein [Marinomonas transparens]|uniref:LysR substrate-binding domain-containing protein n=1 Tax=Marinomonas transparens TaxID=2795388 RepID=A0A934JRV0_9GAMM|nr:LysR substrate-binding domain-containing protein [Marinomonas transparens]MBJ7537126.1 hypothetical protein [Marinomonas transparens]
MEDFIQNGFDVGIRIGEVIEKDMVAVKLSGELRQIAVASPRYLVKYTKPNQPKDLLEHNCILWRWPEAIHPYKWEFYANGLWFAININGSFIVNDRNAALKAALGYRNRVLC